MGQTEGKLTQPPAGADAASHPHDSSSSSSISPSTVPTTNPSREIPTHPSGENIEEGEGEEETEKEGEGEETGGTQNNMLKRSTEIKDGISKFGANIISTAKGKVPYTSYSVSTLPGFKKAASVVEDAIVTVKAGITKTEEEPELVALAKMPLFLPIIKSSVPLTDLAKGVPLQKTTIEYLDPQMILSSLLAYQRYAILTAKMVAARQAEVINKVRDAEMSTGRKAVFTLAINVTDMRHFNTQFSEVGRFYTNLERTKETIKDIIGMFEKLNAALPLEEQLEPIEIPPSTSSFLNSPPAAIPPNFTFPEKPAGI